MSTSIHDHRIPHLEVSDAHQQVTQMLLGQRNQRGFWTGELSSSALATATAISALGRFRKTANLSTEHALQIDETIDKGIAWLMARQNHDGGWGDTPSSHSNISTTMLTQAATHIVGRQEEFEKQLLLGQRYVQTQGGVDGLRRRYGKDKTFAVPILANAAIAGLVPWEEVSALPFEAAIVPQRLYHLLQLPVVSYAIPALVAIGQVKFHMDPPGNPLTRLLRRMSINQGLKVLSRMQPASGGYLEAIPLTSFVVMALCHAGRADHPVVKNGVRFLMDTYRNEGSEGTWPIDTNLATWNTTLTINALTDISPVCENDAETEVETAVLNDDALDWIISCQTTERHPFTGADPGGWGWSDLSGAVPDADDTPSALLALRRWHVRRVDDSARREQIQESARAGIQWLLKLQNRDNGWPTFCRGWGKLPFDRSGSDITAHVIRALHVWQSEFPELDCARAIEKGFQYLESQQQECGAWTPLWFGNQDAECEENPIYGTVKVLLAYRDTNKTDTAAALRGLSWLIGEQNHDGGFGGGVSYDFNPVFDKPGSTVQSSVQETALALEAIAGFLPNPAAIAAGQRATAYLVEAIKQNQCFETWPIGFYFAKLWYYERLYPLIYSASALRCVARQLDQLSDGRQEESFDGNN